MKFFIVLVLILMTVCISKEPSIWFQKADKAQLDKRLIRYYDKATNIICYVYDSDDMQCFDIDKERLMIKASSNKPITKERKITDVKNYDDIDY